MLKRIGLSAAVILASVALAQPAAMAANWNDSRGGNNYQAGNRSSARGDYRDNRDVRDFRGNGEYGARFEQHRFVDRVPQWRAPQYGRGFGFTFRFGDRDHDGDRR
jgi:hypothetical protein